MFNLTLGNWILIGVFVLIAGGSSILFIIMGDKDEELKGLFGLIGTIIIAGIFIFGLNWYHTNTASGIRKYKDYQSNMENGIEREITITAEDGRQIYHYQGKVDVESDHEDNYIKFEREDGGREIIYYGITDTVLITEIK